MQSSVNMSVVKYSHTQRTCLKQLKLKIKIEMESETMEFLYGLGIIFGISLLILLPTLFKRLRKRPEDDLDRFFPEQEKRNMEERRNKS